MNKPLIALSLVFVSLSSFAAGTAFINSQRISQESSLAKSVNAKLEKEFAARLEEVNQLGAQFEAAQNGIRRDAPTWSADELKRKETEAFNLGNQWRNKRVLLEEDMGRRNRQEAAEFDKRAVAVIKKIATDRGFDLVVRDPVYGLPKFDLTEEVLKALK